MLLRVAARLRRGSRVGSHVVHQARTPKIHPSSLNSSGRAALPNRDVRARRQALQQAKLRHSLIAPAGGWIRQLRRETELRRAGRQTELTLRGGRGAFCFRGGGEVEPTGRGWQGEHVRAGRVGQGDEAATENSRQQDGTRRLRTGPHTVTKTTTIVFFCFSFYEAVVPVICVTDLLN